MVLGVLALANLLHYANRNVVVTMYDDLRAAFSVSFAELGLLTTVYTVAHAVATIAVGWLADRFDRRRVLAAGMLLWSSAALGASLATNSTSLLIWRGLLGAGTACCAPVAIAIICNAFPASRKGRSVSIFNVGLFIGGLIGPTIGQAIGFPLGFIVVALPGFALAYVILRIDVPKTVKAPSSAESSRHRLGGLAVLRASTMRWTIVGAILMAFAASSYVAWFYDFLHNVKRASESQALTLLVAGGVAGLMGVLAGGVIGDRLFRSRPYGRQLTIVIGFGASVPLAIAAIVLDLSVLFYVCSWFLMFFITWYHAPLAASVDDLVPTERAASAQGIYIAAMHLLGTAPAPYLVGKLAERVGLEKALYLPTVAMLGAALAFAASLPGVSRNLVVQHQRQ